MNVEPTPPSEIGEPDPDTVFMTGTQSRPADAIDEWALIRYVGQPLGEFILLGNQALTLGRSSSNGLSLADPEVSRHHARLEMVPDEGGPLVHLTDLNSTNGTFVNGRRLDPAAGPVRLTAGDVVRVGGHAFKLKRLDSLERHYHETMLAQSTQDALTGVSNRATVIGFLEKQAELARRHNRPLCVVLCDLDHFKDVNDRFGHPVGDQALQMLGSRILSRLRASDHVGRIGGEEFLLILPETAAREAVAVAENLRRTLASEAFHFEGIPEPCYLTLSFGVAQFQERDKDGGSLFARADVALYRAKALGRNRVESDELG